MMQAMEIDNNNAPAGTDQRAGFLNGPWFYWAVTAFVSAVFFTGMILYLISKTNSNSAAQPAAPATSASTSFSVREFDVESIAAQPAATNRSVVYNFTVAVSAIKNSPSSDFDFKYLKAMVYMGGEGWEIPTEPSPLPPFTILNSNEVAWRLNIAGTIFEELEASRVERLRYIISGNQALPTTFVITGKDHSKTLKVSCPLTVHPENFPAPAISACQNVPQ